MKAYTKFSQQFCSSVPSDLFCAVLRAYTQVSIAQAVDFSPVHNPTCSCATLHVHAVCFLLPY